MIEKNRSHAWQTHAPPLNPAPRKSHASDLPLGPIELPDEHWRGWRLIFAWVAAVAISYAAVAAVVVGLYWLVGVAL